MADAHISENKGPYRFDAFQQPDGTWRIKVGRHIPARTIFGKSRYETLTYTSDKLPSSPKAAWRAASRS